MEELLSMLEKAPDSRQPWKIKHTVKDVIAIVLFASLANASDWMEIYAFATAKEKLLRKYLELENGIPSHDTIQRVPAVVPASFLEAMQRAWNGMLSEAEGEKLKRILAIDGKTMRGSGNVNQSPLHVVSAVATENGLCLGQKAVKEKSNEIAAIPELPGSLNIKGAVITIDAMGTQTEIAQQIIRQKGDCVLALKGNQPSLHEDVKDYFGDPELLGQCGYFKTVEKARSSAEVREYWQAG